MVRDGGITARRVALFAAVLVFFGSVLSGFAEEKLWGTVIETMNSGGYTYARIERDGRKQWLALPETLIQVGDMIEARPGVNMGSYTSPTLGRSFDNIIFSGGLSRHVKVNRNLVKKDAVEAAEIQVEKASGPNAYTIAEMFARKGELDGREVVLRARVVKVSKYKGDNFIHLMDGSGSRKRGNHKLVAVSREAAAKGDVVLLKGILRADKAVGFLSYEVLIEDAKLVKSGA